MSARSPAHPYGVRGVSDRGTGVRGECETANAIEGLTLGDGYAVAGVHFSNDPGGGVLGESVLGNGVEGFTFSSDPNTAAVRGQSAGGNAGLFIGNVKVTGSIIEGWRRIPHRPPRRPEEQVALPFLRRVPGDVERLQRNGDDGCARERPRDPAEVLRGAQPRFPLPADRHWTVRPSHGAGGRSATTSSPSSRTRRK